MALSNVYPGICIVTVRLELRRGRHHESPHERRFELSTHLAYTAA